MSSKTIIVMEDDTDGSEASETVEFAIDGVTYTIDLSDKNAQKLAVASRSTSRQRGSPAAASVRRAGRPPPTSISRP